MGKIYHDQDVNMDILNGKTVAVLGYGSQGRSQALNMKDSGVKVIVAEVPGRAFDRAKEDGMEVMSTPEAAQKADILMILVPDMPQMKIYEEQIKPYLKKGKVLYFSHGFSITFKRIKPSKNVDVIMVAPKAPGPKLRETYLAGFGTPALVAVYQDASGNAKNIALALAKAMHFTKAGVFECTFDQETITDLFGEQAVLCGGVTELIKAGFSTLVEDGYSPEIAYFETLHELKLIVDLIAEGGLEKMWDTVSETARYGGRTRGPVLIDERVRKKMKKILKDVKSKKFAKEWIAEYESGMNKFKQMKEAGMKEQIEVVGGEIRKLFQKPQ